jgi:hypothetical protein
VGHSAVIVGMRPIYTLILAVLSRLERATWHKAAGMAIAFTGIAVLASEHGISTHSPSLLGDAITMTGSVGFATYAVLGKRVVREYDALTMTAYNHFAGALLVLPAGGASGMDAGDGRELASRSVAGVGLHFIYGTVWVGSCVRPLLLAVALLGSFAVERFHVPIARPGIDPRYSDLGREGLMDTGLGRHARTGWCVLDRVGQGFQLAKRRSPDLFNRLVKCETHRAALTCFVERVRLPRLAQFCRRKVRLE